MLSDRPSDRPALGARMRYVDLPPAELVAYLVVLRRCSAELAAVARRLQTADLPTLLQGPCASGLAEAHARLLSELNAIATELQTQAYAVPLDARR